MASNIELGFTKLQACNDMLRTVNIKPFSALDTNGSSEIAEAERVLDRITQLVQADGHPANTEDRTYTLDVSGQAAVDSDVLTIECVAPGRHKGRLKPRYGLLFNSRENTDNLGSSGDEIHVVQRVEMPWNNCPPDLKHAIQARAETEYQILYRGREDLLAYHAQREQEAAATTDREAPSDNTRATNSYPVARPTSGSDAR